MPRYVIVPSGDPDLVCRHSRDYVPLRVGRGKNELVYRTAFPTRAKARRAIAEYIEVF